MLRGNRLKFKANKLKLQIMPKSLYKTMPFLFEHKEQPGVYDLCVNYGLTIDELWTVATLLINELERKGFYLLAEKDE